MEKDEKKEGSLDGLVLSWKRCVGRSTLVSTWVRTQDGGESLHGSGGQKQKRRRALESSEVLVTQVQQNKQR